MRMNDEFSADCRENCGDCQYCPRMTPALIALASVPCDEQDLVAPDSVVNSAVALFTTPDRSVLVSWNGEGPDAMAPVAEQHARHRAPRLGARWRVNLLKGRDGGR